MEQEVAGGSITPEWASLPPDLVRLVADCVLSTSGVDDYMAMRAVCPSWRSAVAKPSPHAAIADPRFRPRQWVFINGADDDQGRPLFLNVSTGRFRRLRLPVLRDYIFVGASDGLLVLGDSEPPHAARLLNPLTGDILHFAAPIYPEAWVETAVAGTEPTIVFSLPPVCFSFYCPLKRGWEDAVYSADPTGQLRAMKFHDAASDDLGLFFLRSMAYAGNVYVLSSGGTLCKIVWTGSHWYGERILDTGRDDNGTLLEYAGKLLLVRKDSEITQVFSVDVERKVLEPIKNIGNSALFLSYSKWMVVDADKLPSIDGNCVYRADAGNQFDSVYVRYESYDLSDGKRKYVNCPQVPQDVCGAESGTIYEGPLSLAQVLLTPYPKVKAQVDRFHQT
ncbi:hypothetical protein CFC21_044538 [Triticum aestivum]|uniref:KIB1-4 beta-propeller domain-containing protein n=3 Tax=Triticum TaxID=4564 RepID=A0A9R1FQR8_WHEAT|nr:hypothetical protein CFC21_044536 [Triticum aestivum]KAF7033440.1 hypothetical protein CFC21_044538 [Triticum aestivum]CDM86662.1 unnamed protein product [Triticum aestivum]VAH85595.1 unnamed protein product [Triticum turgidum subsp. durum]